MTLGRIDAEISSIKIYGRRTGGSPGVGAE
jgi:hypothetical protein